MREWLRALPTFDAPSPAFDVDNPPADPVALFTQWIEAAVTARFPMPHAAVLSTAGGDGVVSARTLILKDLDDGGWVFATRADSPKAEQIASNPRAALTFLWTPLRRQVRVQGSVQRMSAEESAADFLARPPKSRAACLVGRQSEPLASREQYAAAFDDALQQVGDGESIVEPQWAAYRIDPDWVEFWQSTDSGQLRLRYERQGSAWSAGLRWP